MSKREELAKAKARVAELEAELSKSSPLEEEFAKACDSALAIIRSHAENAISARNAARKLADDYGIPFMEEGYPYIPASMRKWKGLDPEIIEQLTGIRCHETATGWYSSQCY